MSGGHNLDFKFHPFRRSPEERLATLPSLDDDDIRPGLEPDDDVFNLGEEYPVGDTYKGGDTVSEYHHSNMKFWGYMIIAFIVMVLSTIAIWTGITSDWYRSLDLPFATNSEIVAIGNVVFLALITFIAYHLHKDKYSKGIRQGSIFFLVATYLLFLAWGADLFGSQSPNNAALYLTFVCVLMAIALWVIWDFPDFVYKKWILVAASVWLLYLMYYTVGILILNENRQECKDCKTKFRRGM